VSEAIQAIGRGASRYRLVIFYIVLFSLNSLASAVIASFMNTDWAALTGTAKFLLLCVIFQSWTGTMLAFFNKSLSRVEQGQSLIETQFTINKTTTPP